MSDESFNDLSALLHEAYKAGRKAALLQAIALSIRHHQPIPDWAASAFDDAYGAVMMGATRSWNDVFGDPHPISKHLKTVQGDNMKFGVYARVQDIHEREGVPIDDELFTRVGKEMRLGGKTRVKELYARVKGLLQRLADDTNAAKI